MAGATLGKAGQCLAWIIYLFLLYSILSAYIAGGGDLFHYLLASRGVSVSYQIAALLFTFSLGTVVYFGIRVVDYVNRSLMLGKLGAYFLLVLLIFPFISVVNLDSGHFEYLTFPTSVTVAVVAFACIMIIPSLRTYFDGDVKLLRKVIIIGTLIPLICYIIWNMSILGVIPFEGSPGLKQMLHSSTSNSQLVMALGILLHKNAITLLAKFFTSICMATSFLSISLSLSDFLSDGLKIAKKGLGNVVVFSATFSPPVAIVLFCPDAFIRGLEYSGISCFMLMILLPAMMVWRGRYHQNLATGYQVRGGKFLLAGLILFASSMIILGLKGAI